MREIDVLYLVEHVARELDIACAVAAKLRREHDMSVEVGSLVFDLERVLAKVRPKVIITPYFYSAADMGIIDLLCCNPEAVYLNLAYEQVISPANMSMKRPRDKTAAEQVLHCASSEFYSQFLLDNEVPPRHAHRIGSLPLGLYLPPYAEFFRPDREQVSAHYGLDLNKRWIFFPENFRSAFFTQEEMDARIKQGCDVDDLIEYHEFGKRSFKTIMSWCTEVGRLDDVELVVRPRPATSSTEFLNAFEAVTGERNVPHLHIIKEGTVREWNMICDATISSYSTTLIEASVVPRPVFLLVPEPIPPRLSVDWYDLPTQIRTRDEFLELLGDCTAGPARSDLTDWANATLLPKGDPLESLSRLVSHIRNGSVPCPHPDPPPSDVQSKRRKKRNLKLFRNNVRRLLGFAIPNRARYYEFDRFTDQDVRERTERWDQIFAQHESRKRAA